MQKTPLYTFGRYFLVDRFCVQRCLYILYLFSFTKQICDLFVVYDLTEICFQGSAAYKAAIDGCFGEGSCHVLNIRNYGAVPVTPDM